MCNDANDREALLLLQEEIDCEINCCEYKKISKLESLKIQWFYLFSVLIEFLKCIQTKILFVILLAFRGLWQIFKEVKFSSFLKKYFFKKCLYPLVTLLSLLCTLLCLPWVLFQVKIWLSFLRVFMWCQDNAII